MSENRIYATGRRKTSTARVWLSEGTGAIKVNGEDLDIGVTRADLRMIIMQAFDVTNAMKKYDVTVNVTGGGVAGQAGAIRHGISRALVKASEMHKTPLKKAGFLTRDPRKKERKKPGQKGARRSFQFTKR